MTSVQKTFMKQFDEELEKAGDRLSAFPSGELGWLVNFIQLDLEVLSPTEWMLIAYEIAQFTDQHIPDKDSLPLVAESGWSVKGLPDEAIFYTLPSRKDGMKLQETVRKHLEHLWEHAVALITFSDLTLIATMPGAFHKRRGSVLVSTKPKTKEFEYRVASLLAHNAERIRPCQECRRIFIAIRRDQLFCTTRCQMRIASRKWRKANKTIRQRSGTNGS